MKLKHLFETTLKTYYHVTPRDNLPLILQQGLTPRLGKRGMYAEGTDPAIYLFVDYDSVVDGVMNWLGDEYPEDIELALLAVRLNPREVMDDPELLWSAVLTKSVIAPENISIVTETL